MDKKLAEYRAQKQKEQLLNNIQNNIKKVFGTVRHRMTHEETTQETDSKTNPEVEQLIQHVDDESEEDDEMDALNDEDIDKIDCFSSKELIIYLTIFLTWSVFFVIFIKLEFGAVYFIVTGLIGMYFNTRTRNKRHGEKSAYSVFNKNCKSIHGSVKAEDLERQMVFGQLI